MPHHYQPCHPHPLAVLLPLQVLASQHTKSLYRKLEAGPTDEERRIALAALRKAEAALVSAQAAYDEIAWMEEVAEMPQTLALQLATLDYESALANYQLVTRGPSPEDLEVAWASVESAKAQLDMLRAGATPEQLAAAQAAVAQAEAAPEVARATLSQATLVAPFAGTVADLQVSPGQIVLPGQVVLTLADLTQLQVETTDLSERDVSEVLAGQQATVYVEALNVDVPGDGWPGSRRWPPRWAETLSTPWWSTWTSSLVACAWG